MASQHEPSRLLTLPSEIKLIIYRYLLPGQVTVCLEAPTLQTTGQQGPHPLCVSQNEELEPNVATCMKMGRVCKTTRRELFGLLTMCVQFQFEWFDTALLFNNILTEDTKTLIQKLEIKQSTYQMNAGAHWRNIWLGALDGYTTLSHLEIHNLSTAKDSAAKGTEFLEESLRFLKAIMTGHPTLGKATWSSSVGPSRRDIRLQCPSLPVDSNATEFNPHEEYEKYLTKGREKNAARKEAKEAKKRAKRSRAKAMLMPVMVQRIIAEGVIADDIWETLREGFVDGHL